MRPTFTSVVSLVAATSILMLSASLYFHHLPRAIFYPSMRDTFDRIREHCGEVCDTTIGPSGRGKYFDVVKKHIDCDKLFGDDFVEGWAQSIEAKPPILESLILSGGDSYYSYQGRINITSDYRNGKPSSSSAAGYITSWTEKLFEEQRALFMKNKLAGSYGLGTTLNVEDLMRSDMMEQIIGGRALVIGSQKPWIEVMLLELGAASVTTLEYNDIESSVKNVRVIKPSDVKRMWKEKTGDSDEELNFDVIVTFSSIEHSGMGRYGDALNPWGDLIASARAWCLTRPGGRMLLGIPTGHDEVQFNSHKIYGPLQMSHMLANWEQIHAKIVLAYLNQQGIVVQKRENKNLGPNSIS